MTRRRAPAAPSLSESDRFLLAFGPLTPRAEIAPPARGALWHPRCATARISALWKVHRREIRDCWKAHPDLRDSLSEHHPWAQERGWFTRQCADAQSRGTPLV